MAETTETTLKKALGLSEKDRAALAGALIESLHEDMDEGVESAWQAEIERRLQELDAGAVETVAWSQVSERLFSGYEWGALASRGSAPCVATRLRSYTESVIEGNRWP